MSKALAAECWVDIQPGVQRKGEWGMMRTSKTYRTHRTCQVLWALTIISLVFTPIFGVKILLSHPFFRGENLGSAKVKSLVWDHAARQRQS